MNAQIFSLEPDERVLLQRLELAIDATEMGLWDWDLRTGKFEWSVLCHALFGLHQNSPVNYEVFLNAVHPDDRLKTHNLIKDCLDPAVRTRYDHMYRILTPDGDLRWIVSKGRVLFEELDGHEHPVRFIGTSRDITIRKKTEVDLANALIEKDALLREIHHRVKNNLQVISSLINLETMQITDATARERMGLVSRRITAIARIHEQLYASGSLNRIDFSANLHELAKSVQNTQSISGLVDINVQTDPIVVDIETAIPLSLIAHELLINSMRHGFPAHRSGTIQTTLGYAGDRVLRLSVSDNGIGLPSGFHLEQHHKLGLKLVQALARQLKAQLIFMPSEKGTTAVVELSPLEKVPHQL